MLNSSGIPVGMTPFHDYKESEMFFEPGDTMVVVSDGILEAMNEKREMFSAERLEKICLQNAHLDVKMLGKTIISNIKMFTNNSNDKLDDQTIVIIKREEKTQLKEKTKYEKLF